jgi:ribose 1,5-bisphosphokinase
MTADVTSRGTLVLVVGPSGAGKDTLIDHLRERLAGYPRLLIVRRVVTREASAGGEQHDTLSEAEFHAQAARGAFAFTWAAHGLHYGLPAALAAALAAGHVVVANVSRAIIAEARRRYPRTLVVNVTASNEVLAHRLAARGRESEDAIRERLARSAQFQPSGEGVVTIDNSGTVEQAGEQLVALIRSLLDAPGNGGGRSK